MTTNAKDAKAFLERLDTDTALQARFESTQATGEAMIAWARTEGYQFTNLELKEAIREKFGASLDAGKGLSDKQLHSVSGGLPSALASSGGLPLARLVAEEMGLSGYYH